MKRLPRTAVIAFVSPAPHRLQRATAATTATRSATTPSTTRSTTSTRATLPHSRRSSAEAKKLQADAPDEVKRRLRRHHRRVRRTRPAPTRRQVRRRRGQRSRSTTRTTATWSIRAPELPRELSLTMPDQPDHPDQPDRRRTRRASGRRPHAHRWPSQPAGRGRSSAGQRPGPRLRSTRGRTCFRRRSSPDATASRCSSRSRCVIAARDRRRRRLPGAARRRRGHPRGLLRRVARPDGRRRPDGRPSAAPDAATADKLKTAMDRAPNAVADDWKKLDDAISSSQSGSPDMSDRRCQALQFAARDRRRRADQVRLAIGYRAYRWPVKRVAWSLSRCRARRHSTDCVANVDAVWHGAGECHTATLPRTVETVERT